MTQPDVPTAAEPEAGEQPWHRLDPRMLLIHPIREVGRFLPVLIGAVFAGRNLSSGVQQWWWPFVAVVGVLAFGALRWFTTTYRFTTKQVQLRTGVVQRNTLAASTDRVRTVDVTASLMHRLLGLASVEIGTGAGDKAVKLDGLPQAEAAALRADLLQHKGAQTLEADLEGAPAEDGAPAYVTPADADHVLYRLNPKWLLYAPLGPTGFVTAAILIGFGFQTADQIGLWDEGSEPPNVLSALAGLGLLAIIAVLAVGVVVGVSLLAIIGFAISYFGFTLSRDPQGHTLHSRRGLITTRSTSLEIRRLRGVELHRPWPLRLFGGARLTAVTTGLNSQEDGKENTSLLTPASPIGVVRSVADSVLGSAVISRPMTAHGPAATRRRYTRAVGPTFVVAAGVVTAGVLFDLLLWALLAAVLLLALAVVVGRSRAANLGHALTDDFLLTQHGALALETVALERDAAVAVTVRRSLFQRRAGVATVTVATAAGRQHYDVTDVPTQRATDLAGALLPR